MLGFPRNLIIYYFGYGITTAGDWAALSGLTYLIYQQSGLLDLSLLQSIPIIASIFIAPLLGDMVDKYNILGLTLIICFSLFLCTILLFHFDFYWYILVIGVKSIFLEILRLSQDKLFPKLVKEKRLPKAYSALTVIRQIASAIGLSLGVYIASNYGLLVFLFDGLTFLVYMSAIILINRKTIFKSKNLKNYAENRKKSKLKRNVYLLVNLEGIRKSYGYIFSSKQLVYCFFMFSICHIGWGMKDVSGVALLEEHFHLGAENFGNYSALGMYAEFLTSLLIFSGIIRYEKNTLIIAFTSSLVLGISFFLPIFSYSFNWIIFTKILEGSMSLTTGMLFGYILIMKSPEKIRASVSAFVMGFAYTFLVLGKLFSGFFEEIIPAALVFSLTGLVIIISAIYFLYKSWLLKTEPIQQET